MNTDKRDLNGFKRFVFGFYPKIGVHLRLSVVKKELLNSLLVFQPRRGVTIINNPSCYHGCQNRPHPNYGLPGLACFSPLPLGEGRVRVFHRDMRPFSTRWQLTLNMELWRVLNREGATRLP